ncbi:MAG: ComEA family DNA-binding protein [Desulfobaccales bacterium]
MRPTRRKVSQTRRQVLWGAGLALLVVFLTQGTAVSAGKAGLVDINTATQAELEAVKGIGPVGAKKIIENRPYQSLEELSKAGLSPKKINEFKSVLTVKAAPAAAPAAAPTAKPAEPTPAAKAPSVADKPAPAAETSTKPKAAQTAPEKAGAPRLAPGERVNINTASQEDLEKIPGIGPVKAQAIIKNRPYKTPEDLMKVRGIKDKTYQKIKNYITVQ